MPLPTSSDVHVNAPLTNLSVAYTQKAERFVAERVFARVPVAKQSDRYIEYNRRDWQRVEAKLRAPGTEAAGGGWRIDNTKSYFCDVVAVKKAIDDQIRANADAVINMDRDATEWVTQQLLMKRDVDWRDAFFTTGKWGLDLTGVPGVPGANEFKQWSDDSSTPIEDITDEITRIGGVTGYEPNVLAVGPHVFNALKNHPDVIDRIKYTQKGVVTAELLAGLLGVEEVVVAKGVVDSSAELAAADATDYIFGKKALLVYREPAPSILKPSAGYCFAWNGLLGASAYGSRIKRYRWDIIASDIVEGEMAYSHKLIAADLGTFFTSAVA